MPSRHRLAPWLGGIGLLVLLAGTFLPWLRSGRAHRNSYRTGGLLRRLIDASGLVDAALAVWPFLGLACAAVVAVYALGARRASAALALVPGIGAGAVAVAVLGVDGSSFAAPVRTGPVVTAIGALAVIIAASLVLFPRRARV